jgi:hypothetical protein
MMKNKTASYMIAIIGVVFGIALMYFGGWRWVLLGTMCVVGGILLFIDTKNENKNQTPTGSAGAAGAA